MSLDDLLKPAKWADEQVLRQYTKVGERIPEEKLYQVTMGLHLLGHLGSVILPQPLPLGYGGIVALPDCLLNIDGLMGNPPTSISGDALIVNPDSEGYLKVTRLSRLPLFLTGISLLGKVAYDTANYFTTGEPFESGTYAQQALSGVGFISMASSMYLKEMDPKLLDKAPFWKTAYNWAKERVKSLAPEPQPMPQPAPLQASAGLEDYVAG